MISYSVSLGVGELSLTLCNLVSLLFWRVPALGGQASWSQLVVPEHVLELGW